MDYSKLSKSKLVEKVNELETKLVKIEKSTKPEQNPLITPDTADNLFYTFFNNIPLLMSISEISDGTYIDINEKYQKFTGFTKQDVIGKTSQEIGFISQEQRDELASYVKKYGRIDNLDLVLNKKDGTTFLCEYSGIVIDIKGQPKLLSIGIDKSSSKNFAEELDYYKKQLDEIINNQNDLIVKFDSKNKLTFVSPQYCQTFGKSIDELLGKSFVPLIHPDDQEKVQKSLENLREYPHNCQHDERALTVSGWKWFNWSNKALIDENGNIKEVLAVGRDISNYKHLEEKLLEKEKQYGFLTENIVDVIWTFNVTKMEFTYVSPSVEKLFGYTVKEILSSPLSLWLSEENISTIKKLTKERIAHFKKKPTKKYYSDQLKIKRKNGSSAWIEIFSYITNNSDTNDLEIVGSSRNITERKLSELKLSNTLLELSQKQQENNALLNISTQILTCDTLSKNLSEIFNQCKKLINAQSGYVALLSKDGKNNEVVHLDSGGLPCDVDPSLPMPIRGLREQAYTQGKAVYDNEFEKSDWKKFIPLNHVILNNVLFSPIKKGDKVIGLIGLANKIGGFTEIDCSVAERFGQMTAIALAQADKQAELAKWKTIFEHAEWGICLLETDTFKIKEVNPKFCTMLGVYKNQILNSPIYEHIQMTNGDDISSHLSKLMQNGVEIFESQHLKSDGKQLSVLVSMRLLEEALGNEEPMVLLKIQDISDIKENELRILEHETKYQQLFSNIKLGIAYHKIILDKSGTPVDYEFLDINEAFEELTGLKRENILNQTVKTVLPNIEDTWIERYGNVALNEEEAEFTDYSKELDKYFEVKSFCPNKGYFIVTFQDVTERIKAENRLKLNKEITETLLIISKLVDYSEDEIIEYGLEAAVSVSSSKGGYLHFLHEDKINLHLFKWSKDVHKICTVEKLSHYPLTAAGVWADSIRQGEPAIHNDYENLVTKKGLPEGHFPIKRHMSVPIFDGDEIVAICGVGNKETLYTQDDVDHIRLLMNEMWVLLIRKRHEAKIKKDETEFRAIFDNSPIGILLRTKDGQLLSANKAFFEIVERSEADFENTSIFELTFNEDIKMEQELRDKLGSEDINSYQIEKRIICKNDTIKWVHTFSTKYTKEQTDDPTYLCIISDITERKNVDELIKHNLNEKTILLREIHHRVKNNLQVIISIIQMQIRSAKSNKIETILTDIQNRARAMSLVHEKLYESDSLANINIKKYMRDLTNTVFHSLNYEQSISLKTNFQNINVSIELAISTGLIINELLTNSLKHAFTELFKAKGISPQITVNFFQVEPDHFKLEFFDNGSGIPKEHLTNSPKTLGLRLINMWSVYQLDGQLDFESDFENGTRFNLRFKSPHRVYKNDKK